MRGKEGRLSESRMLPGRAFTYFPPELHSNKSIYNRSHLRGSEGAGDDLHSISTDGCKNRIEILLRIN
jgi:hypothetical protein